MNKPPDPRVAAVLAAIDKHPHVDICTLADLVNLSPGRLRHLFKQAMATPLATHLKDRRLQRGRVLLETTFLSVKQVAAASGFNDADHFVREFRKLFALPPGEYRRSLRLDSR